MTKLTAITYNLRDGGGDDRRLARQLDLLARLNPSVLALQECKWWDRNGFRRLHQAERVLRMRGFLAESNRHGCHIALFVRESAGIRVTGWYPDSAAPYWHVLARLVTEVDGYHRPVHIVGAHLAPSSPAIRLAEAETFSLLTGPGHDVIALGDFNAIPATGPDPALDGVTRVKARRKLDRRAAQAIEDAGFTDTGAQATNRAPTVGFTGPDRLAYACDRIYTTLPPEAVAGFRVIGADELGAGPADVITVQAVAGVRVLSDHLPAAADFALGSGAAAPTAAPP
jgi:endonuclease/exonuclease/phosphatase family metal-dependent hydrolase